MIDLDLDELIAHYERLEEKAKNIPLNIANDVESRAVFFLQKAADINIYDTQESPGYKRTRDLRRGFDAKLERTNNGMTLQMTGISYAILVEIGGDDAYSDSRTVSSADIAAAQQRAEQSGGAVTPTGRSGLDFTLPAPMFLPAQVQMKRYIISRFFDELFS